VRPPHDETTGAPLNLTLAAALGAPRRRGGGLARELRALALGGGEGEGSDEAEKATQRLRASYLYGLLDGVWFENFTSAYGTASDKPYLAHGSPSFGTWHTPLLPIDHAP